MNTIDVGKFIAEQRKKKLLTQKELAQKLNVTDKAVSKWETGKCYPDIEMIEKLSVLFNVGINEILSGKITEPENQIIEAEKNIIDVMKTSKKLKMKWQIIAVILSVIVIIIAVFSVEKEIRDHQFLTATQASFDAEKTMRISIDEVGLKNVSISQLDEYIMLSEGCYATVFLLSDNRYASDSLAADYYLAVAVNDKIIVKDLAKWENQFSYGGQFYLYDIDGDNDREIILQETVGLSGGAGQYLSRIFDFKDNELVEIFSSVDNSLNDYDTGFSVEILKDKKLKINNSFTQYSETFVLKNRGEDYYSFWYDENGKPEDLELTVDSFCKFEPCDIDLDGIYEIICSQYASLYGHSDFVGTAVSVLKYNTNESVFEIVDAYFDVSN